MAITPVNLSTVNNQSVATHQLYNQLAGAIVQIMDNTVDGYGFPATAVILADPGSPIRLIEWGLLYAEANIINAHLTGSTIPKEYFPNSTSTFVTKELVNTIIGVVNLATADPYQLAANQTAVTSISDVSNPTWDSTITSTIVNTWANSLSLQQFFNLGGRLFSNLNFQEVYPGGIEDTWIGLITEMQGIMAAHPYDRSLFMLGVPQIFSTSVNNTVTGDKIVLTYTPGAATVTVQVQLIVGVLGAAADSAVAKGLEITHRLDIYRSAVVLRAPATTSQQITTGFAQGGQPIIPTIRSLTCSVSSLTYNMNQYDESLHETITLTNTGNTQVYLISVVYSCNQSTNGPIPTVYYNGWTPLPDALWMYVIQPGDSISMDVTYTSRTIGTFNNYIQIVTDADAGFITIKTKQIITGPAFRPQLNITSDMPITSYTVRSKQIAIGVNFGNILESYSMGTCSLMWNGQDISGNPAIFQIDSSLQGGPKVTFRPEAFVEFAGTTTALVTASLSVNCVSASVPGASSQTVNTTTVTTLDINVPPNLHLGSWLSPTSLNNSIVGMSYDIINAHPFLTIGVGLTSDLLDANGKLSDPLPGFIADGSYNFNPSSLGIGADSKWTSGLPLYKVTKDSWKSGDPITGFLYDYGVWFLPDQKSPIDGRLVSRRWLIDIPVTGTYNYRFSADILAYFAIDGNKIADSRESATPGQAQTGFLGTVDLTAGQHILFIAGANFYASGQRTGFALTLQNSISKQLAWSTLDPVRDSEPYLGWSEVYRIPLVTIGTGNPGTYYTSNFVIKDSGAVNQQYKFQDFFGNYKDGSSGAASLFVIKDDGQGNLSINTQLNTIASGLPEADQTMQQLQYVAYYYDTLDFNAPGGQSFSNHSQRLHNLEGPQGDGHRCHQFLGFDYQGNVQVGLTRYPGDAGYDPIPRYYVGSLHIIGPDGTGPGVPDPSVVDVLKALLSDPLLNTLELGIGLFSGGIANDVFQVANFIGKNTGFYSDTLYDVGNWLNGTFNISGGLGSSWVGQTIQSGANSIGQMLGFGGASSPAATTAYESAYNSVLANVPEATIADAEAAGNQAALAAGQNAAGSELLSTIGTAIPYVAAAYAVYTYGGTLYNAVDNALGGGVFGTLGGATADAALAAGVYFAAGGTYAGAAGLAGAEALGADLLALVCFVEDTEIDIADGSQKRIIDVKEGDMVWNHDKTAINQVTFWEYDSSDDSGWLYSPDAKIRPFATLNHPLIIDGEMHVPYPDKNYEIYPWLGQNRRLEHFHTEPLEGRWVYSLWVTGDGTFRVNGYGTHSIFGDGGGLLDAYRRGRLTKEQVLAIRRKFVQQGSDAIYGGHLYNNWLAKVDIKMLTDLSAKTFLEGSNVTLEKIAMYLTKQLGKIARSRLGKG